MTHSYIFFLPFCSDESGAVNEAMSDIFGACVDRYLGQSFANTWKIGEVIFTGGDAMR